MTDPIFWLGFSLLLVAVSLCAVLIAIFPAIQALARAARSVEKLADTLAREFPPTLEAIRLTGMEISELTDDISEGVQSASGVVKQVDQSISGAKKQAQKVQTTTGSVMTGVKVAWKTFQQKSPPAQTRRRQMEQLPPSDRVPVEFPEEGTVEQQGVPGTNTNTPDQPDQGYDPSESFNPTETSESSPSNQELD